MAFTGTVKGSESGYGGAYISFEETPDILSNFPEMPVGSVHISEKYKLPDEVDERGGVVRVSEVIDGVKYTDPTGVTIQAEVFAVTPSPDQVYEIYPLDGRDDPFTLSMKSGIPFEAAGARGLEWYVKCRQQEQI